MTYQEYKCIGGPLNGKFIAVEDGMTEFLTLECLVPNSPWSEGKYVKCRYALRKKTVHSHLAFHWDGWPVPVISGGYFPSIQRVA
jgi:hypothetical protein